MYATGGLRRRRRASIMNRHFNQPVPRGSTLTACPKHGLRRNVPPSGARQRPELRSATSSAYVCGHIGQRYGTRRRTPSRQFSPTATFRQHGPQGNDVSGVSREVSLGSGRSGPDFCRRYSDPRLRVSVSEVDPASFRGPAGDHASDHLA